jgi:hypothetical protein
MDHLVVRAGGASSPNAEGHMSAHEKPHGVQRTGGGAGSRAECIQFDVSEGYVIRLIDLSGL